MGAPLVALAVTTMVTVALLVVSLQERTAPDELPRLDIVGWAVAVAGVLCFAWVRTADLARQSGPDYTIPWWRPMRVATTLAVLGTVAAVSHGLLLAEAVARQ